MRLAIFHPKARDIIRSFPEEIKDELGQALLMVQQGFRLKMPLSRPMSSVASGVEELRIKGRDGIYRAFYFSKSARGILIFHAFQKKTEQTPQLEIKLGRKCLRELLNEEKD